MIKRLQVRVLDFFFFPGSNFGADSVSLFSMHSVPMLLQ